MRAGLTLLGLALVVALVWLLAPERGPAQALPASSVAETPAARDAMLSASSRAAEEARDGRAPEAPEPERGRLASRDGAPETVEPAPGGLLVHVADAEGKPAAGVTVALRMQMGGQGDGGRGMATTAADGLARIELGELAELRAHARELALGLTFSVRAEVASAMPVRTALADWPREGERVELTLPPAGSVRVRLLTREGAPLSGEGQVGWWWVPADVAAADPGCAYERVPAHLLETRAGEASIEGVGLGLTLSFTAHAPGLGSVTVRGIEGPRAPGEVRAVELRLGPPLATLRLRVLDVDGRPLANQSLQGELWSDPERAPPPAAGPLRPAWLALTSDAEGLVTFSTGPGSSAAAPRLDVSRRARGVEASADESWCLASVSLPRILGEGEVVDLGALRLRPIPVIAEGRVLDAQGNPVARASLAFLERFGDGPELPWFNLPDGRLTTGPDGTFRLRGRLPRALGVRVEAAGFASLRREDLEVGARGLELRLAPVEAPPPSGSLAVHVRLEPEISPLALILRIDGKSHDRKPDWLPGRVLTFERFPPGRYDVSVETREGGLELARVEGVEVRAGETTEDPRLLPLDLGGLARTVRLETLRLDGAPRRRQRLELDALEPRSSFQARTDDEGGVTLVLPRRITQLEVALASGARARVSLGGEGPVRAVLAGE